MKNLKMVSALTSAFLSCSVSANVLITEYAEGTGNNKAIEISNLSNQTINLSADGFRLELYNNGSRSASKSLELTGSLAAYQSLVIYNPGGDQNFTFSDGIASDVTYFNGDDAIVLRKNGQVVDSLGQVGVDPGTEWRNSSGFSTKDRTLRRQANVLVGDTNTSDSFPGANPQWAVLSVNTADGLSCIGTTACSQQTDAVLITEYIEGSGSNKAVEISNLGSSNIDLEQGNYKLSAYTNGSTTASAEVSLTGVLVPNSSIVVYNSAADAEFKKAAPQGIASSVANFNGDDALVLTKGETIIDSFGRRGEDPGKAWKDANDSSFSTVNKTLRRNSAVFTGDAIVNDAFPGTVNQWQSFAIDTSNGLGCHGTAACNGSEPTPTDGTDPGDNNNNETPVCFNCPTITKIKDASAFIDSDYYAAALNADSSQLRNAIANIITQDHKQLTYSEIWSVLTHSDEDPNNKNNLILLYTGKSVPKNSNASGTQASNPDGWNREHVWAKSHGFPDRSQLAYTDAHHLRPTDVTVNSTRSSYDFETGGVSVPESPQNFYDKSLQTWEPRDEVKGDVARMMFYMDVRYAGAATDSTPDLVLVNNIGTSTGTPQFGKLCTLYQWALTDVVDDAERRRNNAVYEFQGNRNPFIDHPEWIETLFSAQCTGQ